MKKKLFSLMLALSMVASLFVPAYAEGDVSRHTVTRNAVFEGKLDKDYSETVSRYATLIVNEEGKTEPVYISQIAIGEDGSFQEKFDLKNAGNGALTYSMRVGDSAVSQADVTAVSTTAITYDLSLSNTGNGGAYLTNDSVAEAVLDVKNVYGDSENVKLYIAYYDENMRMLDCVNGNVYVEFNTNGKLKLADNGAVPQNAKYVKVFAWGGEETIVPVAQNDSKEIGNTLFGRGEDKPIVVAFVGDSITHQAKWSRYVEYFYKAKYPNRDITFYNKGMSNDTTGGAKQIGKYGVLNRIEWDVLNDPNIGKVDEVVLMLGMNDVNQFYRDAAGTSREAKISAIMDRYEGIYEKLKANNVTLTIMTPSIYDKTSDSTATVEVGKAEALKNDLTPKMKALAVEKKLPLIDMNEATDSWDTYFKTVTPGDNKPYITGNDRIHPGTFGGFVMAYEFVKQQGFDNLIANVEIDAATGNNTFENAAVTNVTATADGVSYTYKAESLPFAYDAEYSKAVEYGVPVTSDLNREIIKVTGLSDGTYTITMNGTALTKTYTDDELALGVNIATDSNNPGQIQSKELYSKIDSKNVYEGHIRSVFLAEYHLKGDMGFDIDNGDAWQESANPGVLNYYISVVNAYKTHKPHLAEYWSNIKSLQGEINECAKPQSISVVISK